MKHVITFSIVAVMGLFSGNVIAADWNLDKAHSSINFKTKHLVITTVRGEFTDFSGSASFDPRDHSTMSADFTVQMASVNTANEQRDGHLKSSDFFDIENHPTMTFKSKSAKVVAPGKTELTGDLTIRGVTKEVTFDVEGFNQTMEFMGTTKTGGVATATINRQDFGVSWNKTLDNGGLVVSDVVDIEVELEFDQK
jgi:polyisoprenoid-binding protein YceI